MTVLTKRVQVLFPQQAWEELVIRSSKQKESVGALIRKAVEQTYLTSDSESEQKQRKAIIAQLAAMNLPVADWEQMERESTGYETLQ